MEMLRYAILSTFAMKSQNYYFLTNLKDIFILAIESSCDDTSAAILKNDTVLSNIVSSQKIHAQYGGVVPELASRAHQQNIVLVVDAALKEAGLQKTDLDAIAFTQGPGLLGSLIVGASFAKALALALNIPLIGVNHMEGHVLAHLIKDGSPVPSFPFLCLTISGGHTQIVHVKYALDMQVIGTTIDDAAGEAFDKTAKILGLPYPGGPLIDKHAKAGNPLAFTFSKPRIEDLDFSFSGLKTSILYALQKRQKENSNFIQENLADICASVQTTISEILFEKLLKASRELAISEVAIAGGVSANSYIRSELARHGAHQKWNVYIPKFEYCTDNAAMIGITAYYKFLKQDFSDQTITPKARMSIGAKEN
jgi:N6-L-threonylcarbamoyladenine synthase